MDINDKLRCLLKEREWSEYRLAKRSGLSESTIANIFRRNTVPSITTLEAICHGLGISLSQFFAEGDLVELTAEQQKMFEQWATLSTEQKEAIACVIKAFNKDTE